MSPPAVRIPVLSCRMGCLGLRFADRGMLPCVLC